MMGAAVRVQEPEMGLVYPYTTQHGTFSSDLFTEFKKDLEAKSRCKSTVEGYTTCIHQFSNWLLDNGVAQPDQADVAHYVDYINHRDLAATTKNQYIRAVRQFFKWTATHNKYPNIALDAEGPQIRHDTFRKDALEKDAVPAIADSIDRSTEKGKRLYAMYLLCVTAGLRCVEIHRANVEDIEMKGSRCYLWIQGKGHQEKDSKVLLIPPVKEAIDEYLAARSTSYAGNDPLFASTSYNCRGNRIAPTTISTMLKKAMQAAGYDSTRLTAHSLRHTSGTGVYLATHDLMLTQKHQRHADPATTEIYIHAAERETRETEQQVYDYYFGSTDDADAQRQEAMDLIARMAPENLARAIDVLKAME